MKYTGLNFGAEILKTNSMKSEPELALPETLNSI
jgi:hypothetical protein